MNVDKLLELKEWARAEQDKADAGYASEWYQGWWITQGSCGTACCLAGKTVLDLGWQPVVDFWQDSGCRSTVFKDGVEKHVRPIAQEALGLTIEESSRLFDGGNTLKDVEQIIDALVSGTFDPKAWVPERNR